MDDTSMEALIELAAEHGSQEGFHEELQDLEIMLHAMAPHLTPAILERMLERPEIETIFEVAERTPEANLVALRHAGRRHGDFGDPDHEIGDMQDILRAAWDLIDQPTRDAVMARLMPSVFDAPETPSP